MKANAALALKRFIEGELGLSDLEDALGEVARFSFRDTNERYVEYLISDPSTVRFTRMDVERMLLRFLDGRLSARELSDWAAIIKMLDWYELDSTDPVPNEVWDVLDELMSPDAWGNVTTESALAMLRRL